MSNDMRFNSGYPRLDKIYFIHTTEMQTEFVFKRGQRSQMSAGRCGAGMSTKYWLLCRANSTVKLCLIPTASYGTKD